ncbi:MAG: DUF3488 and transglutaminase-like domain-containing protein, partial [Actinomycetota bacterium]|nr:DUF3488 and transglutaminase-like domain-containing protein [Actinomycetota bacterium]
MLERAIQYYRRINKNPPIEESISFRFAVLLTVLIGIGAAIKYGEIDAWIAIPVVLGVIGGSIFSYVKRGESHLVLKSVISILLIVAFIFFLSELGESLTDLRYPLIRLFLWLLALHSFDLPSRRDLNLSLISACILMAFAGSLSTSTDFLGVLTVFFLVGFVSLYLGNRSGTRRKSDVIIDFPGSRRKSWTRAFALFLATIIPLSIILFMAMPRITGMGVGHLPYSQEKKMPTSFEGFIRNPGYGELPDEFPENPLPFNPDAYFGLNRFLDLRVRGKLPDRIVMKVRSERPYYWRALAFDEFLGNGWAISEKEYEEISSNNLPLSLSYPNEPPRYSFKRSIQTFFIEEELPNTIFGAYLIRDVFFPTQILKFNSMMNVLSPIPLDPGLVYTVVSETSYATEEAMRQVKGFYPKEKKERFCQLPADMSPAVGELAENITQGLTNDYDKVQALSDYLQKNYPYDLN